MVDRISIRISDAKLNFDAMGTPFIGVPNGYQKFKIYYNDTPSINDHFLVVKAKARERGIWIDGNLRKWATLGNATSDLNKARLQKVFTRIAERLDLPKLTVLNGIVTMVEVGMNIKMPAHFKQVLNTMEGYKRLKLKEVKGETKDFFCNDYSLIFYDKLREYCKSNKVSRKSWKKLDACVSIIRAELKVKKVCAYEKTALFRTPFALLNNYTRIQEHLMTKINSVKYLNLLSPTTFGLLEGGNRRELTKELAARAIHEIGLDVLRHHIKQNFRTNKVSEDIRHFEDLYMKYRTIDKVGYVPAFKSACKTRLAQLA